jgi:hypothetical protein
VERGSFSAPPAVHGGLDQHRSTTDHILAAADDEAPRYCCRRRRRRNCHTTRSRRKAGNKDTEDFVTARGTQSLWRIGWSFYAGAVGSWVIVTPSQVRTGAVARSQLPWLSARLVLEAALHDTPLLLHGVLVAAAVHLCSMCRLPASSAACRTPSRAACRCCSSVRACRGAGGCLAQQQLAG